MAKKMTPPDRIVNKFIFDYILRNVRYLNIMPSMFFILSLLIMIVLEINK